MQKSSADGIKIRLSEADSLYCVRLGDGRTIHLVPHRELLKTMLKADPARAIDYVTQIHAGSHKEAQQRVYDRTFKDLPVGEADHMVRSYRTIPEAGWFLLLENGTQHFCPTPECLGHHFAAAESRNAEARAMLSDAAYVLEALEKLPNAHTQATLEAMTPTA